jgi:hypothetical protein
LLLVAVDAAENTSPESEIEVVDVPAEVADPASIATPIDPTVATIFAAATSFLYSAASPTQFGVAPNSIDPRRSSVLRGRVVDRDNAALAGVRMSVLDHPEFGVTMTRSDGMFDLAVNGGEWVVVAYEKDGCLPAQRAVMATWQDYAWLPDVALIEIDAAVTQIAFGGAGVQVARGSLVSDSAGSRRATLFVPPGTQATMILPDGSVRTMAELSIRATEYSVGERGPYAMPAELPASSSYTYAVEFSADEAVAAAATEVQFQAPIIGYVENFLGFPVGTVVPAGSYDRSKGSWMASANGRVLEVTDVSGGRAVVDLDGDGIAEDSAALAAFGISDVELEQLARLYPGGQSLWRVPIDHFSPHDCNWPPFLPADAVPPELQPTRDPEVPDPCTISGSLIELENQTVREQVGIVGTERSLHYISSRTVGRRDAYKLEVPLTGATVPPSLVGVELRIFVAGQLTSERLPPLPDQNYVFTWDGKDAYGRQLHGAASITVQLGYVYLAVYGEPADTERAFAAFSRGAGTGVGARDELTVWREWRGSIGAWTAPQAVGLGGWALDVHHTYDPAGRVLYRGDGRRQESAAVGGVLKTVARAAAGSVIAAAIAGDGAVYLVDGGSLIRRIAPDGTDTIVAGGGASDDESIPSTSARLSSVSAVALARDGSLYFAENPRDRIRRVGPDGLIQTVAGGGARDEDGVPAV